MPRIKSLVSYKSSTEAIRAKINTMTCKGYGFPQITKYYWDYFMQGEAFEEKLKLLPNVVESDALLGVEVEIEDCKHINGVACPPGWDMHPDGSLRNGIEYISNILSAEDTKPVLTSLFHFLENYTKAKPKFSWRTSIHIHLNVRELEEDQLLNLLLIYAIFEQVLFQFVGDNRKNSIFCVPLTESNLHTIIPRISNLENKQVDWYGLSEGWQKYSALNLFRLKDYGTVEFRHMAGTWDAGKLIIWTNLLLSMYNAAANTPHKLLVKIIEGLNTMSTYSEFRNSIFGVALGQSLGTISETQRALSRGVTYAKQCLVQVPEKLVQENSPSHKWCQELFTEALKTIALNSKKAKKPKQAFQAWFEPVISTATPGVGQAFTFNNIE